MRETSFESAIYDLKDRERPLTQMEVIRDVMLSAAECVGQIARHSQLWDAARIVADAGWMTLREIAELTSYGEASISAQLRHLRKPQFGGYVIVKRRRGPATNASWEYRIAGHCECARLAWLFRGDTM